MEKGLRDLSGLSKTYLQKENASVYVRKILKIILFFNTQGIRLTVSPVNEGAAKNLVLM